MTRIIRLLKGASIGSSYGVMGANSVVYIEDSGKKMIVDTGHFGNRHVLAARLNEENINPSSIDYVILTHIHWDHSTNIDMFGNSKVIVHKSEMENGSLSPFEKKESLSTRTVKRMISSLDLDLVDEDRIELTSNVFLRETFGHTPGHISVHIIEEKGGTVIAGDSIPNLRAFLRGRPDYVYDDDLAISSIEKIKDLKPILIIPGHDAPFTLNGNQDVEDIDLRIKQRSENDLVIKLGNASAGSPVYSVR